VYARRQAASNENEVLMGHDVDVSGGTGEVNTSFERRVREANDGSSVMKNVSEVVLVQVWIEGTHLGMNGFAEVAESILLDGMGIVRNMLLAASAF